MTDESPRPGLGLKLPLGFNGTDGKGIIAKTWRLRFVLGFS
jgi:hypothetical protein